MLNPSVPVAAVLCAAGAACASPAVLDRVPTDAAMVFAAADVGELLTDIGEVNRLAGPYARTEINVAVSVLQALPGLDRNGSVALVFLTPDPVAQDDADADAPDDGMGYDDGYDDGMYERPSFPFDVALLLPVADFEAMSVGWKPAGRGLYTTEFEGESLYVRNLDGAYALFGADADLVASLDTASGKSGSLESRVGAVGARVADDAEFVIMGDPAMFREQVLEQFEEMKTQASFAAAFAGGVEVAGPLDVVGTGIDQAFADAKAFAFGFSITDNGLVMDMGFAFRDETTSAGMMAAAGDSAELLSRLPAQPAYMAWSLDLSHPVVRDLVGALHNAEMPVRPGDWTAAIDSATGLAEVIGVTQGGVTGGLLRRQVRYIETDSPQATLDALAASITNANGNATGPFRLTTTYKADAQSIAGAQVATYDILAQPDPDAPQGFGGGFMDPNAVMPMLFGGAGPKGFMARVDSGVVQTTARLTPLAESAIKAARDGDGLGESDDIATSAGLLPEGRFAEFYFRADHLANAMGPMAMMMGALPDFEPVESLAPIAGGLAGVEGGLHARLVIPTQLIPTVIGLIPPEPGAPAGIEDDDEPRGIRF